MPPMTYEEALDYIHAVQRFGSKPGLKRINALLDAMSHPERALTFVHIAGTNGKGSTAAMTASIFRSAGLKTGLFVSPFVEDFRERVQIDGNMLPKEEWAQRIERIKNTADAVGTAGDLQATEFELLTALALACFAEHSCDAVVLEVGLGGRFDATNCIPPPAVTVITSLSMDHTQYLGNTLASIAFEKCGIIKQGGRVVTAARQQASAMSVIQRRCLEESAVLTVPDATALQITHMDIEGSAFVYKGKSYTVPLAGAHQCENAVTAIEVARQAALAGLPVTEAHIEQGLRSTKWGGRLEIVRKEPLCLLDGAHNPAKIMALCRSLDELLAGKRILTVMSMSHDKDCAACVPLVAARSAVLLATAYAGERALPAQELAALAGMHAHVEICECPQDACARALTLAQPDEVILVCGSLFVLGEAKKALID